MTEDAFIAHTAVKVKDINGMIKLLEELLGFKVSRKKGDGEVPSTVWYDEGLQLMSEADFEGPEGRLHHLGVMVPDMEAVAQDCRKRGFSEVRPNWFALPDGLVLEFLSK